MRLATGQERSSFPLGNKATRSAPYLSPPAFSTASKAKVLIVGATNLDITAKFNNATSGTSKSAAGSVSFTLGGVGRNMAEACWRSGGAAPFLAPHRFNLTELVVRKSTFRFCYCE
ncbi:hypothetical protein BC830DRAFT_766445 [Chytriomyces sp. MP71]|nr:hypothetical protein BC830DRAFT_766445 [Chytriomyces sp. MP71]